MEFSSFFKCIQSISWTFKIKSIRRIIWIISKQTWIRNGSFSCKEINNFWKYTFLDFFRLKKWRIWFWITILLLQSNSTSLNQIILRNNTSTKLIKNNVKKSSKPIKRRFILFLGIVCSNSIFLVPLRR